MSGGQGDLVLPTGSDDTENTDDEFERQEKELFGHALSRKHNASSETCGDNDSSDLEIEPMT